MADPPSSIVPYTVFTARQKRLLILMIGLSMFFSPFCANIYIACLPALEKAMNTTPQMINLTVTVYLIFQGIAPTIFGDLADTIGRRPTYILTFTLFVVANIGLALQSSYAALLALRILQSAGSSAATAISYAVVADVAPPAERGKMLGPALVATNIGIIIGPLLGGVLADTVGWRWIFWLLAILGGIFLFVLLTFFPETARNIVGSGNLEVGPLNRTLLSYLPVKSETQTVGGEQCYHDRKRSLQRRKWLPNPLKSIRLVFYKDTSLVLSISAMAYMVFFCIQASLPGIFVDVYDLDEAQIGYSFIASGTGVVIGGYMNGKLMDYNYHKTAKSINNTVNETQRGDRISFPIEKARSKSSCVLVSCLAVCIVGYGWAIRARVHISIPLIVTFLQGCLVSCLIQTYNTLLIDTHPEQPSRAGAAGNITRCALAGCGVASIEPLLHAVGPGWTFTILGCAFGFCSLCAICLIRRKGMAWRTTRQMGNQEHSPRLGIQSSGAKSLCDHNGTKTADLGLMKATPEGLALSESKFLPR